METTTLVILIIALAIIGIYVTGYKYGKQKGEERNQQMINFYEKQIDKLYGPYEDDFRNEDWRTNT